MNHIISFHIQDMKNFKLISKLTLIK